MDNIFKFPNVDKGYFYHEDLVCILMDGLRFGGEISDVLYKWDQERKKLEKVLYIQK